MKCMVSEITGFSTHDGPGIRTTVFLKGCPMRCRWCSNPETFTAQRMLYYIASRCRGCGRCRPVCPRDAISERPNRINRDRCDRCMRCVDVCLYGALKVSGREYTAEELCRLLLREKCFYGDEGGLTVSGGEPLMHAPFVAELFRRCRAEGISTVLDTGAHCGPADLEAVLPHTDLVLLDLKLMDPVEHRSWTGVSNDRILQNARTIAGAVRTRISLPLVAGVNDSPENLHATARFAQENGVEWIDVNPLHTLGAAKYRYLGMPSPYRRLRPPGREELEAACETLRGHGLRVSVGRMM